MWHDNCTPRALFNLDTGQVDGEMLTLQNDLHLKARQFMRNFVCLADKERYSCVGAAAMKIASFFADEHLQDSWITEVFKLPTRLTDTGERNLVLEYTKLVKQITENIPIKFMQFWARA